MLHVNLIARSILATTLAAGLLLPAVAMAQGATDAGDLPAETSMSTGPTRSQGWNVTVGGGLLYRPTFEGSDRHTTSLVPLVHATWNDRISIGANGVSAYWRRDALRFGAGLTYGGGRKDSKGDGIFKQGDDRLRGLGEIDPALGVRAFGSYRIGPVALNGAITKFTGDENDGVLMNLGASMRFRPGERWTLTPHLGATWANDNYMRTYYGVTTAQAAGSGFAGFSAGSGFKDVSVGINAIYRIDRHWFVSTLLNAKKLVGDAAKSPISFSDSQTTLMTMVGYRF